jgi:hypothetical protein
VSNVAARSAFGPVRGSSSALIPHQAGEPDIGPVDPFGFSWPAAFSP